MAIRTKTKRRLAILAVITVGVIAVGAGIYTVRMRQIRQQSELKLAEGLDAFERGDYFSAMHALGSYLLRTEEPDPDTLYKYCQARMNVEEPNGKHLLQAAGSLRRLLQLQSDHIGARRDLLELYLQFQYSTETIETADIILKDNPDDPQALRAKAIALGRLDKASQALELAERYNQLRPLDAEGYELTFTLMRKVGRPVDELITRAKAVLAAHPDDPRSKWLMAYAYAHANKPAEAAKWCSAAAGEDPEPALAARIVNLLEYMGEYFEAFNLLQRTAQAHDDPRINRELARRLWQLGRYSQLIDRFSSRSDSDTWRESADSETLGLLAVSLFSVDRSQEAEPLTATLQARQADNLAAAWVIVITKALTNTPSDSSKLIDIWRQALSRAPRHPYFNYFIAKAYTGVGENAQALAALQKAAGAAPAWSTPLIDMARVMLATGKAREAAVLAREITTRRGPGEIGAAIVWAQAWNADPRLNTQQGRAELAELVDRIQKVQPNEPRTLPIKIRLLVQADETQQARDAINAVINSPKKPPLTLLLSLAEASRIYKLGLQQQCLQRGEQEYGTVPLLALALANQEARAGKAQAGLEIIQQARDDAESTQPKLWQLTIARYHESTDPNQARQAWADLIEQYPQDRRILQLALAAESVWSDRDLVDSTINRLKEIAGDHSPSWRFPRARRLVQYDKDQRAIRQAASLLTEAVSMGDDGTNVLLLLARCHQQLGNTSEAIKSLTFVANRRPDQKNIQLQLAVLYYSQGDASMAHSSIAHVLQGSAVRPQQIRQAAVMLAAQGELSHAIDAMTRLDPNTTDSVDLLVLAELRRRRGSIEHEDMQAVEALCEKLMVSPTPAAIQFVADFYASQDEPQKAQSALVRLDELKALRPGQREMVYGNHYARRGDIRKALEYFRSAIGEVPSNAAAHRAIIATYIQAGRSGEAIEAIRVAAEKCPDDDAIRFAYQHRELVSLIDADKSALRPLVVAMIRTSDDRQAAVDFLEAIKKATDQKQLTADVVPIFRQLADRYSRFWPGQAFVIGVYRAIGRPNEAAELATRAMQSFPTATEPARMAGEALAAAERWVEALNAARQWRARSVSKLLPADLKIAEAHMRLGEPELAMDQLQPYIAGAVENPSANVNVRVIDNYAAAMILAGEFQRAAELLKPLAKNSSHWRRKWMQFSAMTISDVEIAAGWLKSSAEMIPTDAQQEWMALAEAWWVLDNRFAGADYSGQVRPILIELISKGNQPAEVFQLMALVDERGSKPADAEVGYRKALELNPGLALAANNLAMLMLRRGDNLDEALELAWRAVRDAPNVADFRDTLAQVHMKRRDYDAAAESMSEAVRLGAGNLKWSVNLAGIYLKAGRNEDARKVLGSIDTAIGNSVRLPDSVKDDLKKLRRALASKPAVGTASR